MTDRFSMVSLSEVLRQYQEYIDAPEPKIYPKLSVKLYGKGVVLDTSADGETLRMKRHQIAKSGQVILSEIWGKKGAIGFVPPEGDGALCTSHFFLFDVRLDRIDPGYLQAIFRANYLQPQLEKPAKGTTGYAAVRPKHLLSAKIPLPPLEEQKRIVTRIDSFLARIEEAKRLRTESIEQSEKIVQAALHKVFSASEKKGWTSVRLEEICQVRRGASPRPKGDPTYFGGDIPWIKISDVTRGPGRFLEETEEGLTEEGKKKSVYLEKETLIITNSATIGLPKILKIAGCIHDGFLAFLNLSENIERDYIYWFFRFTKEHLEQIAPRGTQRNLNTAIAKNLRIPVPSLEEQKKIIAYLDKLDETVESIRSFQKKTEEELEKLVPAILDRAFKGAL